MHTGTRRNSVSPGGSGVGTICSFDSAGSVSIYLTATQDVTEAGSRLGLRVPGCTLAQGDLEARSYG